MRLLLITLLTVSQFAAAAAVKMSESGICHDQSSPWFEKTTSYIPYGSLDACLNDGGRLPRTPKGYVDHATRSAEKIPYKREYFGAGWGDFDHDCQDTRAEVLIELSTQPVRFRNDNGCTVDRGKWISPFTGAVHYKASELDVDHLAALSLVWDRGAYAWDYESRVTFANDLRNLWPVEASLNRSKGDKPISRWLPPTNQCEYVYRYIRILKAYKLHITDDDNMVYENCRNGGHSVENLPNRKELDFGLFKIGISGEARAGSN